jgi:hypothetical protein
MSRLDHPYQQYGAADLLRRIEALESENAAVIAANRVLNGQLAYKQKQIEELTARLTIKWQPIDTFPAEFEGEVLFLFRDGCIGKGDASVLAAPPASWKPTHWCPLPELPYAPEPWRTFQARQRMAS